MKAIRSSNIELCRIIIMLMIILHHAVLHGGGANMEYCANKLIAYFFLPGGKIAFDTFIVISMWFFVDQEFKASRLIKVYLMALFFSILMMTSGYIYGGGQGLKFIDIIAGFLPVCGKMHGFIQTYIAFYLIFPFISNSAKHMTKSQNLYILVVLSSFVFGFLIISSLTWTGQSVYCRLILFIFFFYLIRYIKKYHLEFAYNFKLHLTIFIIAFILDEFIHYSNIFFPGARLLRYQGLIIGDESRLLNVLAGTSLFFVFLNINVASSKIINYFGGSTLAILMMHDSDFFRQYTWDIFKTSQWFYNKYYLLILISVAVTIYVFCTIVDKIRNIIFSKYVFNLSFIQHTQSKIDCIFRTHPN